MKILIVDDEQMGIDGLTESVTEALGKGIELDTFLDPKEALAAVEDAAKGGAPYDIVFQDIEMPGMNGLELAVAIRKCSPDTNLVMVTAYQEYALDAWKLHVSDYLLKPASAEDVKNALGNLRNPLQENKAGTEEKRLRVICFGKFEVFIGDKPLAFHRGRSKELLAYLIDRKGAVCNMAELLGILFEDDNSNSRKSWLRTLVQDLKHTLEEAGVGDVLIKGWNSLSVNCEKIDCDYYKLLEGNPLALNDYSGEYMSQYSWAEMSLGNRY
ncbi:MAG: response regulator [Lachnospiraceae bacterium]|nr:response regulator [Lachnospiraceae bacterium]MBO6298040.1 response regulator [Lachnospiraceae bacterium]MBP3297365.1 response regulator [Lachnospiraceae bacterium]